MSDFDLGVVACAEDWLKRKLSDAEKKAFLDEIHAHMASLPENGARCKTLKLDVNAAYPFWQS